jgi:hypothetical protein
MEENNDTITLRPRRGGGGGVPLWVNVISVIFILLGILMVVASDDVLIGWSSIIFLALGYYG